MEPAPQFFIFEISKQINNPSLFSFYQAPPRILPHLEALALLCTCTSCISITLYNISSMQRALTSRASVLGRSSTSKLRPISSAGFNAQQLRFAHKVRRCFVYGHGRISFRNDLLELEADKYGMIRTSNSVSKLELLSWLVLRRWQRQWQQLWDQKDEMF